MSGRQRPAPGAAGAATLLGLVYPATPQFTGLDDLALHHRRGPLTLCWIYVHLVEELARHAGRGDVLREQVLA